MMGDYDSNGSRSDGNSSNEAEDDFKNKRKSVRNMRGQRGRSTRNQKDRVATANIASRRKIGGLNDT